LLSVDCLIFRCFDAACLLCLFLIASLIRAFFAFFLLGLDFYLQDSYSALFSVWCIFWKRLHIRKIPLCGIWQVLPWTALSSLVTFLYMGTMISGLNAISILINIAFMVFVVWVFTFKDKWIKYLCGVVNFVVGAMTFLLTGENFILFAILYPLLFIGIVTITENINSPMVYPPRQKICFRNVIRTNRIMTTVTSFLLFLSIITLCIPVNAPAQLCLNEFTDVTKQFIGETITVRSTAEQTGAFNNFMSANLDQNGIVRFNRTTPGSWERFYVNASADGS